MTWDEGRCRVSMQFWAGLPVPQLAVVDLLQVQVRLCRPLVLQGSTKNNPRLSRLKCYGCFQHNL